MRRTSVTTKGERQEKKEKNEKEEKERGRERGREVVAVQEGNQGQKKARRRQMRSSKSDAAVGEYIDLLQRRL